MADLARAPGAPDTEYGPPAADRDAALVAAVRAGDERAFAELYERFFRPLVAFARTLLWVRGAVEPTDLVQVVFLRIWERRREWDPPRNLTAYLQSAVHHKAKDLAKHATVDRRVRGRGAPGAVAGTRAGFGSATVAGSAESAASAASTESAYEGRRDSTDGVQALPDRVARNTGELHLVSDELAELVQRALAELPPRCREVYTLIVEEERSPAEVAERLGVSTATVFSQISRARKAVREYLRRFGHEVGAVVGLSVLRTIWRRRAAGAAEVGARVVVDSAGGVGGLVGRIVGLAALLHLGFAVHAVVWLVRLAWPREVVRSDGVAEGVDGSPELEAAVAPEWSEPTFLGQPLVRWLQWLMLGAVSTFVFVMSAPWGPATGGEVGGEVSEAFVRTLVVGVLGLGGAAFVGLRELDVRMQARQLGLLWLARRTAAELGGPGSDSPRSYSFAFEVSAGDWRSALEAARWSRALAPLLYAPLVPLGLMALFSAPGWMSGLLGWEPGVGWRALGVGVGLVAVLPVARLVELLLIKLLLLLTPLVGRSSAGTASVELTERWLVWWEGGEGGGAAGQDGTGVAGPAPRMVPWPRVEAIRETAEQFVFRAARRVYFLPKRAVAAGELGGVREFLRAYGGRAGQGLAWGETSDR